MLLMQRRQNNEDVETCCYGEVVRKEVSVEFSYRDTSTSKDLYICVVSLNKLEFRHFLPIQNCSEHGSVTLRHYERPTDRPTDRLTDRKVHRKVTLPIM